MEIIVGENSGFCNGVENTINKATTAIEKYKKVYCLGEIVHNERVIEELEKKGMITVSNLDDVPNNSKLIIRAHGELKEIYDKAKEKNIEIIDLTCGKIKAIRTKINNKLSEYFIVIIGKKNHPEPLGVRSFSGKNTYIIEDEYDIDGMISLYKNTGLNKIYIVSQTTFNSEKFDNLISIIKNKINDEILVDKTICNATSNRQKETEELSKKVDKMIIIGGKKSSNTKELEIIAKKNCKNVYLVQDKSDIEPNIFKKNDVVGIMAGASTPKKIVEEIIDFIKINN